MAAYHGQNEIDWTTSLIDRLLLLWRRMVWLAVGSEYLLRYIETHTVGEELVVEDVVSEGEVHRREALGEHVLELPSLLSLYEGHHVLPKPNAPFGHVF